MLQAMVEFRSSEPRTDDVRPVSSAVLSELSDKVIERRAFIRIGSLLGTALPLVLTLTPLEARAQSSGS